MKNNNLFEDIDDISFKLKLKEMMKESSFKDCSVSTYQMDENDLDKVLEDLDTYSLFGDKKVIVMKNIEKINYDNNKNYLERFLKYLDNSKEDNLLVMTINKSGSNNSEIKKFIKEVKKRVNTITYKVDSDTLIKNLLKGYKLETGVIKLISSKCLDDLDSIKNECLKLKDYKDNDKNITVDDVNLLVEKRFGDPSEATFDFNRALAENDKKQALKLWRELLNYQNIEPLELIGLIGSQFRIMYQVKLLENEGMSNNEIARILEAHPYRITKTRELTKYYNLDDIGDIIVALAKVDLDIKTTSCNPIDMLEMFILNI